MLTLKISLIFSTVLAMTACTEAPSIPAEKPYYAFNLEWNSDVQSTIQGAQINIKEVTASLLDDNSKCVPPSQFKGSTFSINNSSVNFILYKIAYDRIYNNGVSSPLEKWQQVTQIMRYEFNNMQPGGPNESLWAKVQQKHINSNGTYITQSVRLCNNPSLNHHYSQAFFVT